MASNLRSNKQKRIDRRKYDQVNIPKLGLQRDADTASDRREWQRYKIYMAATVVSIAAGEESLSNLLDMMVFTRVAVSCARELSMVPIPAISGNSTLNAAMVKQFEVFDAKIWAVGARVLKQEQLDALDQLIIAWKEDNPDVRNVAAARFGAFVFDKEEMRGWRALSDGLFSGIGLLPSVGDMTHAVDEARDFSERALFYVEQLQFLLRWQSEYVVYETLAQPDVQVLIANAGQLAQSSDRIAAVFENLPAHTERFELLLAEASRTLAVGGETALRVNEAARARSTCSSRQKMKNRTTFPSTLPSTEAPLPRLLPRPGRLLPQSRRLTGF